MNPLAKILADSLSPHRIRLTTFVIEIPRIVLAELNTHRQCARNSASSRAIPFKVMLDKVRNNPYIPETWEQNEPGMQGHTLLDAETSKRCEEIWLEARDSAVASAEKLYSLNLHKQTLNRLLEPFMWHTVIITATEWSNFFNQRCHPAAHPAIRRTAEAMREVLGQSTPQPVPFDGWHLPLIDERDHDLTLEEKVKVSIARCARVSYLTHDGVRDPSKDLDLYLKLISAGHMSPLEHVARPMCESDPYPITGARSPKRTSSHSQWFEGTQEYRFAGPFNGWVQFRKTVAGEADILEYLRCLEGIRIAANTQ